MSEQPSFSLEDRVAVITGGSRGLGRAMGLAFAHAGADIVVASRRLDSCEQTAAEISEASGRRALPVACHVGDWEQCDALVETCYAEFGKVDVLVNNAGMSPLYDRLENVTEALFDKVIDVNLKGAFRLSALIGARMAEAGRGSIINVSSAAARWSTPDVIPYAAAKAAVNNMTEGMAHCFGPGVRVNCIQPGAFLTDISEAWDMDVFEQRAKGYALQRGGQPEEIVGAALYLASDASSYTTGAILRIDGGFTWAPA